MKFKNHQLLTQIAMMLAIIIVSLLAFYPIIHNAYNLDDWLVTENHKYTSLGWEGIKSIWTNHYYSDDMGYAYGYRPVVLTSFAIEHAIWGESPHIGHFIQMVLYALLNTSLFILLKNLFSKIPWYWIFAGVLLFAVHPIHSEVVASLKNRDELLALLFGLLSMIAIIKFGNKYFYQSMIVGGLLFLLALWSKKSVLPLLALWLMIYPQLKSYTSTRRFWGFELYLAIITFGLVDLKLIYWLPIMLVLTTVNYLIHFPIKWKGEPIHYKPLISYLPIIIVTIAAIWFGDAFLWILTIIIAFITLPKNRYSFALISVLLALGVFYFEWYLFLMLIPIWAWWYKEEFNWDWKIIAAIFVLTTVLRLGLGISSSHWFIIILVAFWIFTPIKIIFKTGVMFIAIIIMAIKSSFMHNFYFVLAMIIPAIIFLLKPKMKNVQWLGLVMLVVLCIPYAQVYLSTLPSIQIGTPEILTDTSQLMDARQLEFVENPLAYNYHWVYNVSMAAQTVVQYLKLLFYPFPLSFYYGYDTMTMHSFFSINGLLYLILVSLVVGGSLWLIKLWKKKGEKQWYYFTLSGFLILMFSLFMFSNLFILVAGIIGERLIFVGSLGFIMLLISLTAHLSRKLKVLEYSFLGIFAILSIIMLIWDQKRAKMWKNSPTLMQRDISFLDQSAQAHNLYALALMQYSMDHEKNEETKLQQQKVAVDHFKNAVEIDPTFFNAAFDMGRAQLVIGDVQGALESFIFSISANRTNYLEPYRQICNIYYNNGLYKEAATWAEKAMQIDPNGSEWPFYIEKSKE